MFVEEVAQSGQEFYEKKLKDMLEPGSNGRFVAIDPAAGNYFIGNTVVEALENAELKTPNADFHVVRVGFPAGVTFVHKVVV